MQWEEYHTASSIPLKHLLPADPLCWRSLTDCPLITREEMKVLNQEKHPPKMKKWLHQMKKTTLRKWRNDRTKWRPTSSKNEEMTTPNEENYPPKMKKWPHQMKKNAFKKWRNDRTKWRKNFPKMKEWPHQMKKTIPQKWRNDRTKWRKISS